jgi:hypothetical protein
MLNYIPNIIHDTSRVDRMEVLKKEIEQQGIEKYNLWDAVYDVRSVYAGINKAHKQIVQWAKENELPEVLIMEDDVKFLGEGAFKYFIENKPKDYDLYLAGIFLGVLQEDNTVKEFTGMTCYFVNEKFYDTFLSVEENKHIDAALSGLGDYKVCVPFVAIQHDGMSSNTQTFCSFSHIFEHRPLFNRI